MYDKPFKICQQFKNRNTIYRRLPLNNIEEPKQWDKVHVDLIGPYSKYIRQQHPGGSVIKNDVSITCMKIIEPATDWFETIKVPTFELEEVTGGNDDFVDKSSTRIDQLLHNRWIIRHSLPRKLIFGKGSEFKRDFTPFLKDFDIKPFLATIKNSQANAMVERMHQVILNIIVTNDLANRVFDYINKWGENLAYVAWVIRASYHRTIQFTPGQSVFGKSIIFNLTSVIDWKVTTAGKHRQVEIDNVKKNARPVTHDCTVGDIVNVEISVIYHKLYEKKQKQYRIK